VWRDEPEDRVVSFVYQERTATVQESWRSKVAGIEVNIERLLDQHGACPQKL
jgi:hypothetical protein